MRAPLRSTLFPYTTLFRSAPAVATAEWANIVDRSSRLGQLTLTSTATSSSRAGDRKSTRLNSSHITISYAVVWLKKKKALQRSLPECGGETKAATGTCHAN